ncbi:MAG: hypothetical protein AABZ11_02325 [Nitrospinota bacterium]
MSAFLGPIHYWMYEKIRNTLSRKAAIFSAFYEKYGSEVESVCGKTRQEIESEDNGRPLDQLIGDSPIHGWLANKIREVETEEAQMVKALLNKYADRDLIEEAAYWHGRGKGVEAKEKYDPEGNIEELYDAVNNYFLDGMPCDQVTEIELQNGSLINRHSDCLHRDCWNNAGVSAELMCTLSRKWIDGFCESLNSKFKHTGKESIVTGSKECFDEYSF